MEMKIEPEINANTTKMRTAWFCLHGESHEEGDAKKFLVKQGIKLTDTMFDEMDGEFWWSFPIELGMTKVQTLKFLRKELGDHEG